MKKVIAKKNRTVAHTRKIARAYDVGCSNCGAKPHKKCRRNAILRMTGALYHAERYNLARLRSDPAPVRYTSGFVATYPDLPGLPSFAQWPSNPLSDPDPVRGDSDVRSVARVREDMGVDTRMLLEAAHIVAQRQKTYGDPYPDMARAAMIWSAILGITVRPDQVALCMQGIKISRAVHGYHSDNPLDGCGYWQVYDTCVQHDRGVHGAAGAATVGTLATTDTGA